MIQEHVIRVSNRTQVNHTDILTYKILSQLDHTSKWWPNATFTKLSEDTFEVSPMGPGSFTWKIIELLENKKVVVEYDGIFKGKGTWFIEKNAAMTYITYSISVTIEHKFFRFINKFVPISRLHSNMMPNVFKELNTYLNNYHEERT